MHHSFVVDMNILLDDESPNSQEKTITLKDAGYYEIIMEAASAKSLWFNKAGENFEHFLVSGSPWTDNIPNKDSKNHIKKICITNNVDTAEAYFEEGLKEIRQFKKEDTNSKYDNNSTSNNNICPSDCFVDCCLVY